MLELCSQKPRFARVLLPFESRKSTLDQLAIAVDVCLFVSSTIPSVYNHLVYIARISYKALQYHIHNVAKTTFDYTTRFTSNFQESKA